MKYYSEDDVMDLIIEAEDCERAYEWGEGNRSIHFEDYHPIEIPDKHGRLVDADKLRGETNYLICTDCEIESCEDCDVEWCKNIIENAPTVLEASK